MKAFLFLIVFIYSSILYAQYDYECGMTPDYPTTLLRGYQTNPPQIGGKNAPAKTLNGAYVRIFCVFAQFSGDTKDPYDANWPLNQLPVWANSFIGTDVNQAPFPVNTISNYFYEMSNGQNIIIGYVYPELVYVNGTINQNYGTSNLSVLQQIDQNVNFQNFDQWRMFGDYQQTFNQTDNYVDAVYIIWRNIDYKWGGIAALGTTYITNDGVIISRRIPTISMTLNIGGNGNYTFQNKLGLLAHEYGHYLYGGYHNFENNYYLFMPDGTIQRGLALMNANSGGGLAMNPQEKYLLGYTTYSDIFYDQAGTLPDFNTTGTVYRIPIPTHINGKPNTTPDEFFAIANHQKVSPYEIRDNKGIYVYHIKSNYYGHNHIDMVTADGLWQWQVVNWTSNPSVWNPANWARYNSAPPAYLPNVKHLSVDRINGRDELQEVVYAQYPNQNYYWWDKLKDENGNYYDGFIPEKSIPWSLGYNQIFSPWSNPPTYDKNRNPIYASMELINVYNGTFSLQFYVGQNNCLSSAPSKPQNLQISANESDEVVLTWSENIEPDIVNWGKYKIYRAEVWGTGEPTSWDLVAIIDAYIGSTPVTSWTDYESYVYTGPRWLHYKITAFDNTQKESIPSDKVKINGKIPKQNNGDKNTPVIYEYNLSQNYPNPFNPVTTISYQIKEQGLVQLIVYDLLGSEVATIVNQTKSEGEYSVNFDASNLPSGVYIYSLRVNDFVQNNKMTLLK